MDSAIRSTVSTESKIFNAALFFLAYDTIFSLFCAISAPIDKNSIHCLYPYRCLPDTQPQVKLRYCIIQARLHHPKQLPAKGYPQNHPFGLSYGHYRGSRSRSRCQSTQYQGKCRIKMKDEVTDNEHQYRCRYGFQNRYQYYFCSVLFQNRKTEIFSGVNAINASAISGRKSIPFITSEGIRLSTYGPISIPITI